MGTCGIFFKKILKNKLNSRKINKNKKIPNFLKNSEKIIKRIWKT